MIPSSQPQIPPQKVLAPVRSDSRTLNEIYRDLSTLTELVSKVMQDQADSNREIANLYEINESLKKKVKKLTVKNTVQAAVISRLLSEIPEKN